MASVPTRGICCAACGTLARIGADDAVFACARCNREQSTQPAPHVERITSGAVQERRGHDELMAFAESVGVRVPCTSLELLVDGLELEVSLDIDSGRVRGLDVSAKGNGLPLARFRRERMSDRDAKETGVSRELQTGDQAFDDAVYIESDCADSDLLVLLASPHVRAAIVELLASFEDIQMNPDRIDATRNFDVRRAFGPDHIRRQLALLRLVAGTTRPLVAAPYKGGPSSMLLLMLFNIPLGWVGFGFVAHHYAPFDHSLIWLAFAIGLTIALVLQPILGRALSGRSTSHTDIPIVRVASFASLPAIVGCIALLANAGFDNAASRTRALNITAIEYDDDDHKTKTTARGDGVGPWSFDFKDDKKTVQVGQKLTVKTKPGTLGYEWPTTRALLEVGGGATLGED
ncbi:MAG: hypothetical protein ACXVEF_14300 [Polyangiales bacterium]